MENRGIEIPIYYGSHSDLTKIDLSFINAKIVVYRGVKFREALKKILHHNAYKHSYKFVSEKRDNEAYFVDSKYKLYAVVPLDISQKFEQEDVRHFYQIMLCIYPSDLTLVKSISLIPLEEKLQSGVLTTYPFRSTGRKYFENFLSIHKTEFKYVRNFLRKYFSSSKNMKYIKYMMSVYTNSFNEYNPVYQFISLIICLEVVVDGKEQLTYRLKRNIAVLCGDNVESCKLIYKNIDQLYKLRSAIIHGSVDPKYDNFEEYYHYLLKLVARLIRELIVHNIPTIIKLNEKITEVGYSQKYLLSDEYVSSKYPILDNIRLTYKEMKKY